MFKYGEHAIRTVKTYTEEGELDQILGTEEVEIIRALKLRRVDAGKVVVRPLGSDDEITVHIRDLSAVPA